MNLLPPNKNKIMQNKFAFSAVTFAIVSNGFDLEKMQFEDHDT